mmetsp:Transcript_25571/g.36005  ORF Transcript_25571/g.36005 Transcript_25571/m.36005 type:complete len:384 (+) Transcript_25571:121-1272(+)
MSTLFVLFEEEDYKLNKHQAQNKLKTRKRNFFQGDRSAWAKNKRRLLFKKDDGTFHTSTSMDQESVDYSTKDKLFPFSRAHRNQSSDCTQETEKDDGIDSFQSVSVSLSGEDQPCEVELCLMPQKTLHNNKNKQKRRPKLLESFRRKKRKQNNSSENDKASCIIKISSNEDEDPADECCPAESTNSPRKKLQERKTSKRLEAFIGKITTRENKSIPPPPSYPPPPVSTIEARIPIAAPKKELGQSYQLKRNNHFGRNRQEIKSSLKTINVFHQTATDENQDRLSIHPPSSNPPLVPDLTFKTANIEKAHSPRYGKFNEFKYERSKYYGKKKKEKKLRSRAIVKAPRELEEVALEQKRSDVTARAANLGGEENLSNLFKGLFST